MYFRTICPTASSLDQDDEYYGGVGEMVTTAPGATQRRTQGLPGKLSFYFFTAYVLSLSLYYIEPLAFP